MAYPPPTEVLNRVFVAGRDTAFNREWLMAQHITHVVNCTNNIPNVFASPQEPPTPPGSPKRAKADRKTAPKYFRAGLRNVSGQDFLSVASDAHAFIQAALNDAAQRHRVLVHGYNGRSRPAAIVLYHMLRSAHDAMGERPTGSNGQSSLGCDIAVLFRTLKRAYRYAAPNLGFWKSLVEAERVITEAQVVRDAKTWPLEFRMLDANTVAADLESHQISWAAPLPPQCDEDLARLKLKVGKQFIRRCSAYRAPTTEAHVLAQWPLDAPGGSDAIVLATLLLESLESTVAERAAVSRLVSLLQWNHGAVCPSEASSAFEILLTRDFADIVLDAPFAKTYATEMHQGYVEWSAAEAFVRHDVASHRVLNFKKAVDNLASVVRIGPSSSAPGCAAAVVRSGKVAHQWCAGWTRVTRTGFGGGAEGKRIDPDTCFLTAYQQNRSRPGMPAGGGAR